MKYLKILAIFSAGIGIGVVSTMEYFKTKYEKYANDEIESIRDYYKELSEFESDIPKDNKTEETDQKIKDSYNDMIRRINYNSMAKEKIAENWKKEVSESVEEKNHPVDDIPEEPYEITVGEFEEFDPYFEKIMLSYYADGVLADDRDEMIDDINETVGQKNFEKFIREDMDAIYIRNPKLSIDYEIDRILASYKESVGGIM